MVNDRRILRLLSLLMLFGSFASSADSDNNPNNLSSSSSGGDNFSSGPAANVNNHLSYQFENEWIDAVVNVLKFSNERNRREISDSRKNTFSGCPSFFYSIHDSNGGCGGMIYYDGWYPSFNCFKKSVLKSILSHLLSCREKKLRKKILNENLNYSERTSACDELGDIVKIFEFDDFSRLINKHFNDDEINKLEIVLR